MPTKTPATDRWKASVKALVSGGMRPAAAIKKAVRGDVRSYIDMLRESNLSDSQIVDEVAKFYPEPPKKGRR